MNIHCFEYQNKYTVKGHTIAKIMLFANYSLLSSANLVSLTQVFFRHTLVKFNYVYMFNIP